MSKAYIGIDIGKSGAIAVLYPNGSIRTMKMPLINTELDYTDLYSIISQCTTIDGHIVFEKLGVIFGSAKHTAFSMGFQSGAVEMACVASKVSYSKVRAVDWQREMFQGVEEITKTGSTKKDTKAMALVAIKRLFPNLKLTFGDRASKAHDGLVDAVLMAEYARRKNL